MSEPKIDLDKLIEEGWGTIALQIRDQVAWWGNALESPLTVSSVIASASRELTAEEKADALKFYDGDQWPEDVKALRSGMPFGEGMPRNPPRPCLVVNRLPELVATAIANEYGPHFIAAGEAIPAELAAELETLKIVITRQNRDAQMLYNYLISTYAEIISQRAK